MAEQRRARRSGAMVLLSAAAAMAVWLVASNSAAFLQPAAAGRPSVAMKAAAAEADESSMGRRVVLGGAALLGSLEQGAEGVRAEEGDFDVVLSISLGGDSPSEASITVRVHPEWAPKGAAQFKKLVEQGWYDQAGVFRVVPGFVAQFGLPAVPQKQLANIPDDTVKVSNKRGSLVFATAGPNTRTSQLFINYKDNSFLDRQGFSPFAEVLGDGMAIVEKFYAGYGEKPNQGSITALGNAYLDKQFPKLTKITKAAIQ